MAGIGKKLWSGLTDGTLHEAVHKFNESLSVDIRLYRQDIEGSIAHATMLAECGIISVADSSLIIEGLEGILKDIEEGKLDPHEDCEDIHMFVEEVLTQRIGAAGARLHTARSRNDQVAVDMRLFVRNEATQIRSLVVSMREVIVNIAEDHLNSVMPGYTHLQRAQPITLAHHLMSYAEMLSRDISRLDDMLKRMDSSPLGAGALASTTYPINRETTARALGFSHVSLNSIDAVSDRDYCLELLSALSIMMMHLSRLAEEVILWTSWEFKFASLQDSFATGSSIMPQKKNPDVAELVRGKIGRVYGSLVGLLTVMKGLPLAYNKDMQEDKELVFDAIDTVKACLEVFAPMISSLSFNTGRMRKAAAEGFLNATDCADYLVRKGLPFREAYSIVGALVRRCMQEEHTLESLPLESYQESSPLFSQDIYDAINLEACVNNRRTIGGPSPKTVSQHIQTMK